MQTVKQRGARNFIDVKSGGGPVRAPCPIRRAINPGGQTPYLRLLYFKSKDLIIFFILLKFLRNTTLL